MQRRGFVVAAGALLAGCTGESETGSDDSGGSSGGGDANQQESTSEATDTPEPTPTATSTPSGPPTHEIGESFTVGDGERAVRYTVREMAATDEVGGEVLSETADGTFLVVRLSMENVGDESFNVSSNLFQAVNSEGQTFDVDTDALTVLGESALVFEQVNPGLSTEGRIVFDVPAGEYELEVAPAGFASTATPHRVELGSV